MRFPSLNQGKEKKEEMELEKSEIRVEKVLNLWSSFPFKSRENVGIN